MSLMSLPLLLQLCTACLVILTWMFLEMGGKWPYSCSFVRRCFQDLFKMVCHILVLFPSSSMCFVSIYVVHPYSCTDTATACKKSHFILSDKSNFHTIANLLIAVHAFVRHILTSLSVDETLLLRYVNFSTNLSKCKYNFKK